MSPLRLRGVACVLVNFADDPVGLKVEGELWEVLCVLRGVVKGVGLLK